MVGRFEGIFVTSSLIKERWYCSWGRKRKKNHSEAETNQSNQSFRTKLPPCSQPQPRSGQPANSPANNSPAVRTKRRCGGSSAWPLEGSLAPLFSSLLLPAVILPLDAHALCRALSDSPLLFSPFQLGRRSLADSKRDTFPGTETVCFSPALSPDSLLWFCSFSERRSVIIS